MTRRGFAAAVLGAIAWSSAGTASAQSKEDLTRASDLFKEGKALLKDGNDADACARFAESKALAPAVGVTLYLADCLQRIGKTASAWTEFRSAETLAREHHDKRADLAQHRAEALEPTLDRLTIRVSPALANASVLVACDGKAVSSSDWGVALPVDPGNHLILARAGGLLRAFQAHVDDSTPTASIDIDDLHEEKPAAHTPAARAEPLSPTESTASEPEKLAAAPGDSRRLLFSLALAGAGAVGIGVGLEFGAMAKSDRNKSDDGPCNVADFCTSQGLALRHQAINEALVSTIAVGAGVVALGAGAIVLLVTPHSSRPSAVVVAPAPVAGGAAAILHGQF
jgi:hypothetical protein